MLTSSPPAHDPLVGRTASAFESSEIAFFAVGRCTEELRCIESGIDVSPLMDLSNRRFRILPGKCFESVSASVSSSELKSFRRSTHRGLSGK